MDVERQRVLESAMAIARQAQAMASEPQVVWQRRAPDEMAGAPGPMPNFYDAAAYPTAELLHLMLRDLREDSGRSGRSGASQYFVSLFAGFDNDVPLLERMAVGLIDHSLHGQARVRALVCVNHMAYAFLTALQAEEQDQRPPSGAPTPGAALRHAMAQSRLRYRANMLAAVQYLDPAAEVVEADAVDGADVSLLYALHAGAMLMQDLGYMRQCWKLNVATCRVAAALRGRSADERRLQSARDREGVRMVLRKSFIYDMAMSANIYQPACLAAMDVDRHVPDTAKPANAMLSVMLACAEVQESLVRETRKCVRQQPGSGPTRRCDPATLAALARRMEGPVRAQVEAFRARPEFADDYLQFEWRSIDLNYYSMMTSITRLGAAGDDDPDAHIKCLENARRCLFTLKAMLAQYTKAAVPDRYLSSLAW